MRSGRKGSFCQNSALRSNPARPRRPGDARDVIPDEEQGPRAG
jgi:hypothetical protein